MHDLEGIAGFIGTSRIAIFKKHFYFAESWLFDKFHDHSLIKTPMEACSFAVTANRDCNLAHKRDALSLYVKAINAVRAALEDPQRAVEDATLVATILLCQFERLNPDATSLSTDWAIHTEGLIQVVCSRGLRQTQTRLGRAIFREARERILSDSLRKEIDLPSCLISWTQACCHDEAYSLHDQLAILQARGAALCHSCRERTGSKSAVLIRDMLQLDVDFEGWADTASKMLNFKPWLTTSSFGNDTENSTRGVTGHGLWLTWYTCRVMIAMRREAIMQASRQSHASPQTSTWELSMLRRQTIAIVCSSAACYRTTTTMLQQGSVAFELSLVRPLWVAGICLQKELQNSKGPVNGMDGEVDTRETGHLSQQLDYVLDRLRHIAFSLGDRHASEVYNLLT